jgi:membrane associated rhomboid family serine protease
MSFAERRVAHGGRKPEQLSPVVKVLLILNIGLYFADELFFNRVIRHFGEFSILSSINDRKIWQFITFQFLHGSVLHIVLNSLGLFFFGPFLEQRMGSLKFLFFYLTCGIGGAAFFVLLVFIGILPAINIDASLVGASAGIYGIVIAVAVIAPALSVSLLFPPITLSMRRLALVAIVISIGIILFDIGNNQGGEAGHLGGAIVGFILIQLARVMGIEMKKKPRSRKRKYEPKIRPRTIVDLHAQTEVDEILDKISREGFQSLTDEERDLLHRASKNEQD